MTTNVAVEFLIWLLIAASVIAVIAARLNSLHSGTGHRRSGAGLSSLPIVATLVKNQPDLAHPQHRIGNLSSPSAL